MLLTRNIRCHRLAICTATVLAPLVWITLTIGCNPVTKHRLLNFFFDGVPPLEQPETETAADSLAQGASAEGLPEDSTALAEPVWSSHPQSDNGDCQTCHDANQSFRLYDEPEVLCLNCHDQPDTEFLHAPVVAGACTECCHDPHGTRFPPLLVASGEELCFQCHAEERILPPDTSYVHTPVAEGDCGQCHSPHGSENPQLLVVTEEALCFQCHNAEELRPAVAVSVHAPVAADACTDCHDPHGSGNPWMLVESGQALCLQCHDEDDIRSSETHAEIEDLSCSDCHDPHSADSEHLIR